VKISSPVEPWERGTELDLQEGPEFLHNGPSAFIIYSTRESWLPAYKLGQLRLNSPTADPLQPGSWTKSGPVFAGTTDVYGAGHAGFATSPDGTEQWILYHSKTLTTPGWNDRVIRMQKFTWKADGSPNFGLPAPAGQLLPLPSGECTQTLGVLELDALDPGLAHAA
jgi:GH43 family beta-xylosidase